MESHSMNSLGSGWVFFPPLSYLCNSPTLLHVDTADYFLFADSAPLHEHVTVYLPILLSMDFVAVFYFSIMKNATMKILIHVLGCTFVSISVFVIYRCVTNSHKLQTTHIIPQFLWVSIFHFRVSHRLQSRCPPGLGSHLKSQLGKAFFPSSHCGWLNSVSGRLLG